MLIFYIFRMRFKNHHNELLKIKHYDVNRGFFITKFVRKFHNFVRSCFIQFENVFGEFFFLELFSLFITRRCSHYKEKVNQ